MLRVGVAAFAIMAKGPWVQYEPLLSGLRVWPFTRLCHNLCHCLCHSLYHRREPKKRSQAVERLSHLPCPLHQVCPSAAATAPCSSLEPRFRPSALVKRPQAAMSSITRWKRGRGPDCHEHLGQRCSCAPASLHALWKGGCSPSRH